MDILTAIETRRSIRRFTDQPVEPEKIKTILDAARKAPSWTNGQCWHFIVVTDQNTKEKIAELSSVESFFAPRGYKTNPAQKGIAKAPVVIVATANPKASGNLWGQPYYMTDIGIASQNIMLTAHSLGLGTVFVGVFYEDKIKELLDIPEDIRVVGLFPIGYPATEQRKKTGRKELKEIASSEKWGNPFDIKD